MVTVWVASGGRYDEYGVTTDGVGAATITYTPPWNMGGNFTVGSYHTVKSSVIQDTYEVQGIVVQVQVGTITAYVGDPQATQSFFLVCTSGYVMMHNA